MPALLIIALLQLTGCVSTPNEQLASGGAVYEYDRMTKPDGTVSQKLRVASARKIEDVFVSVGSQGEVVVKAGALTSHLQGVLDGPISNALDAAIHRGLPGLPAINVPGLTGGSQ